MKLQDIAKQIQLAKHIVLMGHKGGDADCYGSMFGLKLGLETLGKKVDIISTEDFPDSLSFLFFYFTGILKTEFDPEADLFILLDGSDVGRMASPTIIDSYRKAGIPIAHLDHHTRGDLATYANYSFADEKACSTSEIVYDLLTQMGATLDKNCATCLLTGIVGDTSSFQNQNTTESCFAVASELMKRGARQRVITNHLFGGKEVDSLKVWGLAMERLHLDKASGVVTTYLSHTDIDEFGLSLDVLSGIVNFLNSIKGAKVVMLIAEEEVGTIKVSLRTRDEHINVASLARQFGGGGHVKAAGFSFPGSLNQLTEGTNSHIVIT